MRVDGWGFDSIRPEQGREFVVFTAGQGRWGEAPPSSVYLSQEIRLNPGDLLSGWAFVPGFEEAACGRFEDPRSSSCGRNGRAGDDSTGWVRILDPFGNEIAAPWRANLEDGHGGRPPSRPAEPSGWIYWEWQAPGRGLYTLELGMTVGERGGCQQDFLCFDNICVRAIPEPRSATLIIFGACLAALTAGFRKLWPAAHPTNTPHRTHISRNSWKRPAESAKPADPRRTRGV